MNVPLMRVVHRAGLPPVMLTERIRDRRQRSRTARPAAGRRLCGNRRGAPGHGPLVVRPGVPTEAMAVVREGDIQVVRSPCHQVDNADVHDLSECCSGSADPSSQPSSSSSADEWTGSTGWSPGVAVTGATAMLDRGRPLPTRVWRGDDRALDASSLLSGRTDTSLPEALRGSKPWRRPRHPHRRSRR